MTLPRTLLVRAAEEVTIMSVFWDACGNGRRIPAKLLLIRRGKVRRTDSTIGQGEGNAKTTTRQ